MVKITEISNIILGVVPIKVLNVEQHEAQYHSTKNFWYIDTGLPYASFFYPVAYKISNRSGWNCVFTSDATTQTWLLKFAETVPSGSYNVFVYYL